MVIEAEGAPDAVDQLVARLPDEAPPMSVIERIETRALPARGGRARAEFSIAAGINSPLTSSAGRLFDAVAALLGVRDAITYEGQAAIELEQRAALAVTDGYRAGITDTEPFTIVGADLIRAVIDDLRAAVPTSWIAARFHAGVARAIVEACQRAHAATGLQTVALSGGVFQNVLLVNATVTGLKAAGFTVLTHHRVPPNDGGISFGQAVIAAARDRAAA